MVAADQTKMPVKMTLRGPMRSAMGPEISEETANTVRLAQASQPSLKFER
jgi:hypothetical protein